MKTLARGRRAPGFTLVELLTVMFVIGLLIAILVPAVTSARVLAKSTKTRAFVKGLETALESFKVDNGNEYPATNGYPPSYSHPNIGGYNFQPLEGQFPFDITNAKPQVFGAHWLVAMLMGADGQGFISRSVVPPSQKDKPNEWYNPTVNNTPLPRKTLYVNFEQRDLRATSRLPGQPAGGTASPELFSNWDAMKNYPVFVDQFDQPILYYAANKFARPTALVERLHDKASGGWTDQPYYYHEDNEGFTGKTDGGTITHGWNFSGSVVSTGQMLHKISRAGNELDATNLHAQGLGDGGGDETQDDRKTFAYYILDRQSLDQVATPTASTPVRPIRPDSYILISAGPDGRYGTSDDINNLGQRSVD